MELLMFPRRTKVKNKGRTYCYVQLVESYRRDSDKMPATKVVANLGNLSDLEFENLRRAFEASKESKTVVINDKFLSCSKTRQVLKPTHNLRYLHILVLLEIWRQYGIEGYLRKLFKNEQQSVVDPASIITSLVLHRCDDPNSKLAATRWYPKTALPELFAIDDRAFNNTRIHRSLELIDRYQHSIMARMPFFCGGKNPKFATFFLDVTDATFCGQGPSKAQRGKAKNGSLKRKIGIVLLCSEEGFPLRWEVVEGNANDSKTMMAMIKEIKDVQWIGETPIVCDRAMGKSAHIVDMYQTGVSFLTALTKTEFASYTSNIPYLNWKGGLNEEKEKLFEEARQLARETKDFKEIEDGLFIVDCGKITKKIIIKSEGIANDKDRVNEAMQICRKINQGVADQKYSSAQAAGAALGIKKSLVQRYRKLGRLPLDIQSRILSGEAKNCSIDDIIALTKLESNDEITIKFEELVILRQENPAKSISKSVQKADKSLEFTVRVVVYFNPEIFIEKKIGAKKTLDRIKTYEEDINSRLRNGCRKRSREHVLSEIRKYLQKDDLLEAFSIKIDLHKGENSKYVREVTIDVKLEEWEKRHRYDGFSVIVCSEKIKAKAAEICRLYRDKNKVEASFRTIKSVLDIQPIRHRKDEKVRAHVTICMLALFLEKALQKRLGDNISAASAIEILDSCFLNRYFEAGEPIYSITETTKEQFKIFKKLGLENLANDEFLMERMTPRT